LLLRHRRSWTIRLERWVQRAPISGMLVAMPRVIQIRDVPDDVHDALRDAAEARGLSLTKYMLGELERLAKQAQVVHNNAAIVRQTQARVGGGADRGAILAALRDGRGE
jgi:hypothetical protein